ncbi:virion protein [Pseudomonas phage AIIMS-Pa-A1]|uniref:Virion protein n=2 Tax=Phikmvvirus TaxID=477967 RepID=A0A455NTH4_9CAUD|nr:minor head protein [Pseudomonas phage RLP]AZS49164.1 virion protein [Pseudomonas phage RLP]QPP21127.1 virion protein [Pseudomonas phage AIIMS-Pa-A1]
MATFAAATQKDLRAFAGTIENLIRPLEEAALGSGYNETKLRAELVAHLDELMAAVETAKAKVYK